MAFCNIGLARESDEKLLRECLRSNEMSGAISVAFESEPNFFNAINIQGTETQVVVGKTEDDRIIGFGTRAIRPVYVNGEVMDIGYLSGLRINPEFRNNSFLAKGYKFFRDLDSDGKVPFYLTTIIEDNVVARRILESGRASLPNYIPIDKLSTFIIKTGKRKGRKVHEVVKGSEVGLEAIVGFMNEHGRDKQFFPYYNESNFGTGKLRGLNQGDFYVAIEDDEILGVVAKWDQESFKQTRVTGYDWRMQVARPLINLTSKFSNIPKLPKEGQLLHYFYASFPVIKENDPTILSSLLNEVASDQQNRSYDYFILGLTEKDNLIEAIKPFHPRVYPSIVYLVSFDKSKEDLKYLNGKTSYLEVGTL